MCERNFHPLDERRCASRFLRDPDLEYALLRRLTGETTRVVVHDESLGGLGLLVDRLEGFQLGARAEIVYHGNRLDAMLRHITRQEDGRFLLGFECRGPHGPSPTAARD